jgi:hypothetical protein
MRIRGFMVILLLVMVITFYLYIVKTGGEEAIQETVSAFDRAKHQLTETNMKTLERLITLYTADHGALPARLEDLSSLGPMTTGSKDAWGKKFKYERLSDLKFRLTSSGADFQFGTEDDISMEF